MGERICDFVSGSSLIKRRKNKGSFWWETTFDSISRDCSGRYRFNDWGSKRGRCMLAFLSYGALVCLYYKAAGQHCCQSCARIKGSDLRLCLRVIMFKSIPCFKTVWSFIKPIAQCESSVFSFETFLVTLSHTPNRIGIWPPFQLVGGDFQRHKGTACLLFNLFEEIPDI